MTQDTQTTERENVSELVPLGVTNSRLAELRRDYQGLEIVDGDEATYKAVSEAISELSGLRTKVENRRKELKAPILARGKLIDDEAKRITGELKSIEDPLFEERRRVIEARKAEKRAAEKVEADRVKRIEAALAAIDEIPRGYDLLDSDGLQNTLRFLQELEITDEVYQEQKAAAVERRDSWVQVIQGALAKRLQLEAEDRARQEEDARLKAEREEIERQKKELADRQAEEERKKHDREIELRTQIAHVAEEPDRVRGRSINYIEERLARLCDERPSATHYGGLWGEAVDVWDKAVADMNRTLEEAKRAEADRQAAEAREQARAAKEAEEAERRRPDAQKINAWLDKISGALTVPAVQDPEFVKAANATVSRITKAINDCRHQATRLTGGES